MQVSRSTDSILQCEGVRRIRVYAAVFRLSVSAFELPGVVMRDFSGFNEHCDCGADHACTGIP